MTTTPAPAIAVVALDTGPLGAITGPVRAATTVAINAWLLGLLSAGVRVVVPEIADYEVRRELLRAGKTDGLQRLDIFNNSAQGRYLHLTTPEIRLAAELWARARNMGRATADPKELDGDVLIAAQVLSLGLPVAQVIVATGNVGHLGLFVAASDWRNITP